MYFRLLNKSSTWRISLTDGSVMDVVRGEAGITLRGVEYGSLDSILRANPGSSVSFAGSGSDVFELRTDDGDIYKIKPESGKLKLLGKSIKVSIFESWADIFKHFSELYLKNIEVFERPEYICTDSKGRYVATVRSRAKSDMPNMDPNNWDVFVIEGKILFSSVDLDDSIRHILQSTTI